MTDSFSEQQMSHPQPEEQPEIAETQFPSFWKSTASFLWEVLKTVLISVAIIMAIRALLFKPFYVKGASMEPTYEDNEYLIINEIDYRFHEPRRGDVVVFRFPRDKTQFFIKRVIGLPEETVSVEGGSVVIRNAQHPDGFTLDETLYLAEDVKTLGVVTIKLGSDEYFVLGDNRPASLDSRSAILGPIPRSVIIGRTWFRIWPFQRMSAFSSLVYPEP